MTVQEAIKRIEEFGLHHAIRDLPHSTYTVEAFDMAIAALKKQIPMKPKIVRKEFGTLYSYSCPVCTKYFGSRDVRGSILFERKKYCNCGQAIDWSN